MLQPVHHAEVTGDFARCLANRLKLWFVMSIGVLKADLFNGLCYFFFYFSSTVVTNILIVNIKPSIVLGQ